MTERGEAALTLRLLGGMEIITADGRNITPTGKKLRGLIACLALAPRGGWPRERLMTLLWGDRDEEQARASLRQGLAELRRSFGEPCPVDADRERAGFRPELIRVDALEFVHLSEAGALEAAAELYQGELLDGLALPDVGFTDWLHGERTRLQDLAIDVFARLAASQSGDTAIATLQRLLQLDPSREETHRMLMNLYAVSGRRSQALRQYQLCCDHMQRELGVKPELETDRLLKDIQLSAASQAENPGLDSRRLPPAAVRASVIARALAKAQTIPVLPPSGRRRWVGLIGVVAIVIALGAVTWQFSSKARTGIAKPSIAVVPFENLSGDPEQGFLADGFTQDVITEMTRNGQLAVLAYHTSASLKGKGEKALDHASAFGVRYLLQGSLRRVDDRLRLSVQLVDGQGGRHMWAERYDIRSKDILATQDDIARRVAGSLLANVRETEIANILRRPPESLDVYELALRGLAHKHQFTSEALKAGRAVLQRAIELDRNYAPAYAYLGYLEAVDAVGNFTGERRLEDLDAAIALTQQAIRLDPSLAYSYQCLSFAFSAKGEPAAALRYAEKAVELGPSDADNLIFYGRELATNGRFAEAIAAGERAFLLNPLPPVYYYPQQARSLYGAGRLDDVVRLTQNCVDRGSYHRTCRAMRIAALMELGRTSDAKAEVLDFVAHAPGLTLKNLARASGYSGDAATNGRFLSRLREAGLPEAEAVTVTKE
jgi:TolB-like protein/DNA-binding SARP family transcriptional activator